MSDTMKKALVGVLTALLVLIGLWIYDLTGSAPQPQPTGVPSTSPSSSPSVGVSPTSSPVVTGSPSPSPLPSLSATPSPSPSSAQTALVATRGVKDVPNWANSQELIAARAETAYLLVKKLTPGCEPIVVTGAGADITVRGYQVGYYTTTIPSTKGTRVGAWADPLTPTASLCQDKMLWLDVIVGKTAAPGTYALNVNSAQVSLSVTSRVMPDSPTMPLYMEMGGFVAMQAQGYSKDSQVSIEAPVHASYIKTLRANRIEPIKQSIVGIVSDINQWSAYGGSFKQLVLDGRIAPPCILSPTGTYGGGGLYPAATLATVQSLMTSGALPPDSYGYIRDEDAAQYDAQIIPIFQQVKAAVPPLRRMMTENRASLDAYVTDPVFDFESWTTVPAAGKSQNRTNFWLYGACQSQGTCSNGAQGTPTGSPMMLIDSPASHQRAYPLVGKMAGARAMLYYNTTEALMTAWTDQRRFGGNGDGTLLYPTTGTNPPVESIRMKLVRQGMFDAEHIEWAGKAKVTIPDKLAVMKMTATEEELEGLHNYLALSTNSTLEKFKLMLGF